VAGFTDLVPKEQAAGGGGVGGGAVNLKHAWSKRFGDSKTQAPPLVAVGPLGDIAITGSFEGAVNLGGGTLASAGDSDVFVAKLNSDGEHVWSKRFGDSNQQTVAGIGVMGSGGPIIIAGHFLGELDFGVVKLESGVNFDVFVAKLQSDGQVVWAKSFTGLGPQEVRAAAVDADGNIYLTGLFLGLLNFNPCQPAMGGGGAGGTGCDDGGGGMGGAGLGDLLVSEGDYDAFVVKLDSEGNHIWSKRFGDGAPQHGHNLVVDHQGNLVLTGHLQGAADFGSGDVLSSAGNDDIFVAKYDANGVHVWSKVLGDGQAQSPNGIVVDSADNILISGDFAGSVTFGGEQLDSASPSTVDAFVVKLDPAGNHIWSKNFGDESDQNGASVAVDSDDNVMVTGTFLQTIDLGGGAFESAGDRDVFFAKFDPNGAHVCSLRIGGAGPDVVQSRNIGVDATGHAVLGGSFHSTVDFGGGPLTSEGGEDIFVVRLSP
jgi:hypothetical protein